MFLGGPTVCTCADCSAVVSLAANPIRRETDANLVNTITNHPRVKPTISYSSDYADFSALFDEPDRYIVLSDGKQVASLWEWSAPGVWQGHSAILPDARGEYGIAASKAMIRWMFNETGADKLWGQTPLKHGAARMFNRLIGGKPDGTGVHHVAGPVEYFVFRNTGR